MARNILYAWMNGEHVGRLERSASHGLAFYYARSWLESPLGRPLSLSLPLRAADDPWRGSVVNNYFENLLPETVRQRQQLRMQFAARSIDSFDLLAVLGGDTPGAVQLTAQEGAPHNQPDNAHCLDELQLEQMLVSLARHAPHSGSGALGAACALGGARDKTALLLHQGRWSLPVPGGVSTHIIKLPFERHSDSGYMLSAPLENAWLCQRVASAFGVPLVPCEIVHFGAQKALVINRTDRRVCSETGRILCLPREDMCQAMGLPPSEKYQVNGAPSLTRMARLLLGSSQAESDRLALLRTQLVFWMLCAFDGHAKNVTLALQAAGRYRLEAPLGVLSAYPLLGYTQGKLSVDKVRMALGVTDQEVPEIWQSVRVADWLALAQRCAVPAPQMRQLINEVSAQALQVSAGLRKRLPAGFPVAVSEPILQGVVHAAQRLRAVN